MQKARFWRAFFVYALSSLSSSSSNQPRIHPEKHGCSAQGRGMTNGKEAASGSHLLHRRNRPVHHIRLATRQTATTCGNDIVGEAERDGAGGIKPRDLFLRQTDIERGQ